MGKFIKHLFSIVFIITLVLGFVACGKTPKLSTEEKLEKVINNTSQTISSVSDRIMTDYNAESVPLNMMSINIFANVKEQASFNRELSNSFKINPN